MMPGLERGSTSIELQRMGAISSMFAPKTSQFLTGIRNLLLVLLDWITLPLELFLRVEHGERQLSLLRIFNAYGALQVFDLLTLLLPVIVGMFIPNPGLASFVSELMGSYAVHPLFKALFLVVAMLHLWRISYRRRKGIVWHSQSWGISVFEVTGVLARVNGLLRRWHVPYQLTDWHVYLYIEPLLGIAIAHMLDPIAPVTALWLRVASISLFVRNQMMYAYQRHRLLDYWDAQIEADSLQEAAQGAPAREVGGIMVVPGFADTAATAEDLDIGGRVRRTLS